MSQGIDVIGDVHGQFGKLEALLRTMGYRHRDGAWRHPDRTALFIGDLIDRGPGQLDVLHAVRDMVEAGSARVILGNHELNAIGFHTPSRMHHGHYLRIRGSKNRHQHQAFLDAVGEDTPLHQTWIDWFNTLPLWIETDGLRAVHACWDPRQIAFLASRLNPDGTLSDEMLHAAHVDKAPEREAVEILCKGPEFDLPAEVTWLDKDGMVRNAARLAWWDTDATTYRRAAVAPPQVRAQLPDTPLPADARMAVPTDKPVFFGHYWMHGIPTLMGPTYCCLDWSAARDAEPLVAYRFDGEPVLSDAGFVATCG